MTIRQQIDALAAEQGQPCVSISLNTHRTHPDNMQDAVQLKKLLKEAETRITDEFGKRPVSDLLDKLAAIPESLDMNYNLDSLHIFISNSTQQVVKSIWPSKHEGVHIADHFAIRPLIKMYSRSEDYLIMLVSQSGVHLYHAVHDHILHEIRNEDFPFTENRHYSTHADKLSDAKHVDDLLREYLNKIDKALVKVHQESNMSCVVISTEDNYSHLLQVADKPAVYTGHASVNYNDTSVHHLAKQGWAVMRSKQEEKTNHAVAALNEAVAQGKVITDLQEIFQAALDGRGDMLLVEEGFSQAVQMTGDRTFDLAKDSHAPGTIDDISSQIAWEVLSKKGQVYFVAVGSLGTPGKIALKTRY